MIGLQVISRGMQHRRKGSHELNLESSRSHSIMTVYCNTAADSDSETGGSPGTMGKISFVDLVSQSATSCTHLKLLMLAGQCSLHRHGICLRGVIRHTGGQRAHVGGHAFCENLHKT